MPLVVVVVVGGLVRRFEGTIEGVFVGGEVKEVGEEVIGIVVGVDDDSWVGGVVVGESPIGVGALVGALVGLLVGLLVGVFVGDCVGVLVGLLVGCSVSGALVSRGGPTPPIEKAIISPTSEKS